MDTDTITERIIGSAITVSNTVGVEFLEKVYENALAHELRKSGLGVVQQQSLQVLYDDVGGGEYTPDLLIEGAVIVELKAAKGIDTVHEAQLLNYLKASGVKVGLILNFGTPRFGIINKRMRM
ncbi:MAG TPA: GxxExxY protein [Candidatus Kryptonia bacterium]|nr:GxxExxY protein [Candidatus Kryptonia bacterium]